MPTAQDQAKKHIESIRANYKLPGNNEDINHDNLIVRGFNSALKILSEQIYPDEYHFIWELIQNNDDSDYNAVQPELRIALTSNKLYVWSNQVGFSREDVDSICRLGESSKIAKVDTIGEKGIGFKSLFTVADTVTIKSKPYHFKFDTTTLLGNLGMLVPTWVEEPGYTTDQEIRFPKEGTLLSLNLKPKIKLVELQAQLKKLNCDFLIFCRRLRKIKVSSDITGLDFVKIAELTDKTNDSVVLNVKDQAAGKDWRLRFRLFSKELKGMPQQSERPKQDTSIVRLAFPLPRDWNTGLMEERTYAFMPMRRYGFNFMIHANFILVANRGEVAPFHKWNRRLRDGLVDLIQTAIHWFATSTTSPAFIHWPRYVNSLFSVKDTFFAPLAKEVCDRLRVTPLLVTEGTDIRFFQSPTQGLSIPDDFRYEGMLILDDVEIAQRSISKVYLEHSVIKEALKKLGLTEFSYDDFLHEFANVVKRDSGVYHGRSLLWHSFVAKALLSARHRSSQAFLQTCQGLDIVPLVSGEWTAPEPNTVFLPGEDMQDIPLSLSVKIVEVSACEDKDRRFLFEALGLRACNKEQICKSITAHRSNHREDTLEDTVSQLKFLYLSDYKPKASDFFMFYQIQASGDTPDPAIHIPFGITGSSIKCQLGDASKYLRWLPADYEVVAAEGQVDRFVTWLESWPQLRLWPEVCSDHQLTKVMAKMFAMKGSQSFLTYLQFRVSRGPKLPVADERWRYCISNLEVTTDQGLKKLCETALPNIASLSEGTIPSLDIPLSSNTAWSFLADFGVITSTDSRFLRQRLRSIKSNNQIKSVQSVISKIYHDLGKLTQEEASIRQSFQSEKLIYVEDCGWIEAQSCRWDAGYECTVFPLLSKVYPSCSQLFKHMLGIKAADIDDLLEELRKWSTATTINNVDIDVAESIYKLLLELNKMLKNKAATWRQISDMKTIKMFPIFDAGPIAESISIQLRKSTDAFWIGDMPSLQSRFSGKAPLLLPMHGTTTSDLNAIYRTLGMENKKLTRCVTSLITSDGHLGALDEQLKKSLRLKIPYLISLLNHVEEVKDNRKTFVSQLENLHVQRVKDIKLRRYIEDGNKRIYGTDEEGEICLKPEANKLVIHVDIEMEQSDFLNLLADHLNRYWSLEYQHCHLVNKVLSSSSHRRYIEEFEKAGIIITNVDEANNPWTGSQQMIQNPGIKSVSRRNKSKSDEVSSLILEHDKEVIYISDNEDYDEDQAMMGVISPPESTLAGNVTLERDQARTTQSISGITHIALIDDTENQHRSISSRSPELRRPRRRPINRTSAQIPDTTPMALEEIFLRTTDRNASGDAIRSTRSNTDAKSRPRGPQGSFPKNATWTGTQGHEDNRSSKAMSSRDPAAEDVISNRLRKRPRSNVGVDASIANDGITHAIGRAGEQRVYNFLSGLLGSSFSHEHWTSGNRIGMFPSNPFTGEEWNHADFTYKDTDGKFGKYLASNVPSYNSHYLRSKCPTYHLEVKTSLGGIDEPAVLSNNQIRLAREFASVVQPNGTTQHEHIYVLVRVYDLRQGSSAGPKICFFPDVWSLICQGKLAIEGDEGVYVRPMSLL